jgi:hypothetical protein
MAEELVARSKIANDITALGSEIRIGEHQLDGSFVTKSVHPRVRDAKIADTFIRNYLSDLIGFNLDTIRIFEIENIPTVVATIYGVTPPHAQDIRAMEARLKEKLGDPDVRLVISFIEGRLYDQSGPLHLEFSGIIPLDDAQQADAEKIATAVDDKLSTFEGLLVSRIEYNIIDGVAYVLAETHGPRMITPEDVITIERSASSETSLPVKLFVHA